MVFFPVEEDAVNAEERDEQGYVCVHVVEYE